MKIRHLFRVGLLGLVAVTVTSCALKAGVISKAQGSDRAQQSLPPDLAAEVDRAQGRHPEVPATADTPTFIAAFAMEGRLFLADAEGFLYPVIKDTVYFVRVAKLVGRAGQDFIALDASNRRHLAVRLR